MSGGGEPKLKQKPDKKKMRQVAREVVRRSAGGRKKTDEEIQTLVSQLSPKRGGNETIEQYMTRFKNRHQAQRLDGTDYAFAETTAKTYWKDELRQEEEAEKKPLTKVELAAQKARTTPFADLDTDVETELYTVTRARSRSIQQASGTEEWGGYKNFEAYADGKSAAEAAEEAIAQLDLSGSSSGTHSRHDFQDASSGTVNLQVQLGGSKDWRRFKGDTSWTMVAINEELWDAMKAADATRWKSVIQAAHRESLDNCQAIRIGPPSDS
jgi:hypothetical protein